MHELFELLQENRLTVLGLAEEKDKNEFSFNNEDNDIISVLVQDDDGEVIDATVSKARIVEKKVKRTNSVYKTIEIFIDDWNSWEDDNIALSTTINNVYTEMYKQLEN